MKWVELIGWILFTIKGMYHYWKDDYQKATFCIVMAIWFKVD